MTDGPTLSFLARAMPCSFCARRLFRMIHNGATPKIEIDTETYDVRADGELLTCEPAGQAPMGAEVFFVLNLLSQLGVERWRLQPRTLALSFRCPHAPKPRPMVHISEPHVRVTEWEVPPGAETGWHRHEGGLCRRPAGAMATFCSRSPAAPPRTATPQAPCPLTRGARASSTMSSTPIPYRLFAFIEIEHLKP